MVSCSRNRRQTDNTIAVVCEEAGAVY
jgi:hypothetical protein